MRQFFASGLLISLLVFGSLSLASAHYSMSQLNSSEWSGTKADRLQPEVPGSYEFDYGEEASVTFDLPTTWEFIFYGVPYSKIIADSDGNIWFGSAGSGPRIAVWNADMNSYYNGGIFIERKSGPDRVVVQWVTETTEFAGYGQENSFEAVLYQDASIKINYQSLSSLATEDNGSGITNGSNWVSLPSNVPGLAGTSYSFYRKDSDLDGVFDDLDNCLLAENPDQWDNENDGLGDECDPDDDNDGILDSIEDDPKYANFLSSTNPTDAGDDQDGDGLTNLQEALFGSNLDGELTEGYLTPDFERWVSAVIMPIINNLLLN